MICYYPNFSLLSHLSQIGGNIDGEQGHDMSGFSVSLSSDGTIVAIGTTGISNVGQVRVYQWRYFSSGDNINDYNVDDFNIS